MFRRSSPPRSNKKIAQFIGPDFRQSHQYPRVIQIVIGDVELLWSSAHHFFALVEIDADYQRLAILMESREEFSFDFESRRAVRGRFFSAGQSLCNFANRIEGDGFSFAFAGFHLPLSVARFAGLRFLRYFIPGWRASR